MRDETDRLTWQLRGIRLCLRGDRSLLLEDTGSLLVADLHLGKSRHFRSRGLRVPEGADQDSAERLLDTVSAARPRELVILGDLLHSAGALSPELIHRLVGDAGERGVEQVFLIRGNHDRGCRSMEILEAAGITVLPALRHASGLELRHEPPSAPAAPYVAGHLHPVARISAPGERLRLPAFVIEEAGIILPAFGSFTGGAPVEVQPRRRRVAAWEGALIALDGDLSNAAQ